MRATVYVPKGAGYEADKVDVEVETVEGLLLELTKTAPVRTRVVVYHQGTTHFMLTSHGWSQVMRVIAA